MIARFLNLLAEPNSLMRRYVGRHRARRWS